MLFESVLEAGIDNIKLDDEPFDDEEEDDGEYCPDKDENDYSQDAADDEDFERDFANMSVDVDADDKEQKSNENEDTSNMIDID